RSALLGTKVAHYATESPPLVVGIPEAFRVLSVGRGAAGERPDASGRFCFFRFSIFENFENFEIWNFAKLFRAILIWRKISAHEFCCRRLEFGMRPGRLRAWVLVSTLSSVFPSGQPINARCYTHPTSIIFSKTFSSTS